MASIFGTAHTSNTAATAREKRDAEQSAKFAPRLEQTFSDDTVTEYEVISSSYVMGKIRQFAEENNNGIITRQPVQAWGRPGGVRQMSLLGTYKTVKSAQAAIISL
jgi:hypothetical protein